MSALITIDGGTTNTRISLVSDGEIKTTVKLKIGSGAGTDGVYELKKAIKNTIEKILKENCMNENNIEKILASGMITSEFGLCKLDHVTVPADISKLHDTMFETVIDDVSNIPFVFIRGVKTSCESFENADMMRGEETELVGLLNSDNKKCVYVLPGSHSKIIFVDESGAIVNFSTMLTGEMIASLSEHTILRDAVDLSVDKTDDDYLLKGFDYCMKNGINEALFKVRILKNIFGCSKDQTYSFFLGAVLTDEILKIKNSDCEKVVIGGRVQIRKAIAKLLESDKSKEILCLDDKTVDESVIRGQIKVYYAN